MKLRVLIVDDESLARERLKLMLADEDDIEIAGECADGDEALERISTTALDLLFLDIQMPGLTGLDVARQIGPQHLPPTIFLTAFHQYAVDAFSLEAVDYLTKPVERTRFKQALQRVRQTIAAKDTVTAQTRLAAVLQRLDERAAEEKTYLSRLIAPDGPKDVLIPVRSIEWIEASDYYSSLHVKQRTYLLRESLSDLEQKLDPNCFVRVHRSALVNLDYLQEIHREGVREGTVTLTGGTSIRISKSGRQRLRAFVGDQSP